MTYRELFSELSKCSQEQLDDTVTVYLEEMDEYFGISALGVSVESDVLDENHLVLIQGEPFPDNVEEFDGDKIFDTRFPITTVRGLIAYKVPIGYDQYGENKDAWLYIIDVTPEGVLTVSNGRQYFPKSLEPDEVGDIWWFPKEQRGDHDCIVLGTHEIIHGS